MDPKSSLSMVAKMVRWLAPKRERQRERKRERVRERGRERERKRELNTIEKKDYVYAV